MKVYIAAPFFNPRQLEIVKGVESILRAAGIDFFSPRSQGKSLKDMTEDEVMKTKKEVFDANIDNMESCTHMVACVEEKDTGTSFEIGYYSKSDKPIVLFSEKIDRINVMLAEAAFTVCDDVLKLHLSLDGKYTVTVGELI